MKWHEGVPYDLEALDLRWPVTPRERCAVLVLDA